MWEKCPSRIGQEEIKRKKRPGKGEGYPLGWAPILAGLGANSRGGAKIEASEWLQLKRVPFCAFIIRKVRERNRP